MKDESIDGQILQPLKITCTSTNCEENLHCFKPTREMDDANKGMCRTCGADLIDWKRVQKKALSDMQHTFEALKLEYYRHHYWHKAIDQKAINHAKRKGRIGLRGAVRKRLINSVSKFNKQFDGRQTPQEGNIIYYAQHALACCCRKCIEYWHGIPRDTNLSEPQIEYFENLIMMYIDDRVPDLTDNGEFIPPIRGKIGG